MIGAGYVGLVAAVAFARAGVRVVLAERHSERRGLIRRGQAPFYEAGLPEALAAALASGTLTVVADAQEAACDASVVFVAVGTPAGADGRPDLQALRAASAACVAVMPRGAVLVLKSTAPVGTADEVQAHAVSVDRADVAVVASPEFLAEGRALADFERPSRVVVGGRPEAVDQVEALYRRVVGPDVPVLRMSARSAELAKYASNVMLAARISLMNELSGVAEAVGADMLDVQAVVGSDPRIGDAHLRPGPGFGGSCFPKDLLAIEHMAAGCGESAELVAAVRSVNVRQPVRSYQRLLSLWGALHAGGRRVAVWGLAFKPGTDDVRESPALTLIDRLVDDGAEVVAFDPVAGAAVARWSGRVVAASDALAALEGADGLVIVTDWPEFRALDLSAMGRRMRHRIVVDARNLLSPEAAVAAGFVWAGTGRPVVAPPDGAGPFSTPSAGPEYP